MVRPTPGGIIRVLDPKLLTHIPRFGLILVVGCARQRSYLREFLVTEKTEDVHHEFNAVLDL